MNKPSVQGVASITPASSTTVIGKRFLRIVNTGSKIAYLRLNAVSAAVVTDCPVAVNEVVQINTAENSRVYSFSAICGGADVTNLTYLAWD